MATRQFVGSFDDAGLEGPPGPQGPPGPAADESRVVALEARVAALESGIVVEPPTEPPATDVLRPGDDPQAWYDAHPGGAIRVEGTHHRFSVLVTPGAPRTFVLAPDAVLSGDGAQYAFNYGGGDGLVVHGGTVRGYSPPSQRGAINGIGSTGWVIEDVTATENANYGIRIGNAMTVRGCHLTHNGTLGIGGTGTGRVLIENVVSAYNNWLGSPDEDIARTAQLFQDDPGWDDWRAHMTVNWVWEGGGSKFTQTDGLIVRGGHWHHNAGIGIWTDIDNQNEVIENALVEYNAGPGINIELGLGGGAIRGCTSRYNGIMDDSWGWGSQIMVQSSWGYTVEGNTATAGPKGGNGITLIDQRRDRWLGAMNNAIVDNLIVNEATRLCAEGIFSDRGAEGFPASQPGANTFDGNTYHGNHRWSHIGWRDFAYWQGLGYDVNGSLNG